MGNYPYCCFILALRWRHVVIGRSWRMEFCFSTLDIRNISETGRSANDRCAVALWEFKAGTPPDVQHHHGATFKTPTVTQFHRSLHLNQVKSSLNTHDSEAVLRWIFIFHSGVVLRGPNPCRRSLSLFSPASSPQRKVRRRSST